MKNGLYEKLFDTVIAKKKKKNQTKNFEFQFQFFILTSKLCICSLPILFTHVL